MGRTTSNGHLAGQSMEGRHWGTLVTPGSVVKLVNQLPSMAVAN